MQRRTLAQLLQELDKLRAAVPVVLDRNAQGMRLEDPNGRSLSDRLSFEEMFAFLEGFNKCLEEYGRLWGPQKSS